MRFLCDSDAHAYADFPCRSRCGPKPERALGAQIEPVQTLCDLHRGGEAAGAARKLGQAFCVAMALHPVDSFKRLQAAQEHSFADAFAIAGNVEHVVIAVDEVHVGVATVEKKRFVTQGEAAKSVRGCVADDISFGFDDAAAQSDVGQIVDQRLADEEAREFNCLDGKLAATKAADANFWARRHHANRSIIRGGRARLRSFS